MLQCLTALLRRGRAVASFLLPHAGGVFHLVREIMVSAVEAGVLLRAKRLVGESIFDDENKRLDRSVKRKIMCAKNVEIIPYRDAEIAGNKVALILCGEEGDSGVLTFRLQNDRLELINDCCPPAPAAWL